MRKPFNKLWLLSFVTVIGMALLNVGVQGVEPAMQRPARPEVPQGSDCWHTEPGTMQEIGPLRPNTFGPGSQRVPKTEIAFEGIPLTPDFVAAPYPRGCGCPEDVTTTITWEDRHGNPITDPNRMRHAVKQVVDRTTTVDTCVRRQTNARFRGQGAVKVDIILKALRLRSVNPLTVSYKGGPDKQFDVCVRESRGRPWGPSWMNFTPNGKVKLHHLRFNYDVAFVERRGARTECGVEVFAGPIVLRNQRLDLVGTAGTFTQRP